MRKKNRFLKTYYSLKKIVVEKMKQPINMTDYEKYRLITLSIFCFLFLIILFNYSQNGRYILREESYIILDSRDGTMYFPSSKTYREIDGFTEKN